MKFQLAINLERMDDGTDIKAVRDHTLEMVKMADAAGFEIAWAAEHHALEMTIAPNPFQILTWWGEHTENIRLGVGVVNAAYWHPINLAGEAAFLDLTSGGRSGVRHRVGCVSARVRPDEAGPRSERQLALHAGDAAGGAEALGGGLCP